MSSPATGGDENLERGFEGQGPSLGQASSRKRASSARFSRVRPIPLWRRLSSGGMDTPAARRCSLQAACSAIARSKITAWASAWQTWEEGRRRVSWKGPRA